MRTFKLAQCLTSVTLALACSDSTRVPAAPTGVTAVGGNGQVTVSWTAVSGASSYTLFSSSTSGAGTSGTAATGITGTSSTVTGLTNGTAYFFVVTASSSAGQSGISGEVTATPDVPAQSDLTGTWRFSVLSAGTGPGWQRGTLTVGADGTVVFSSYFDSAGRTTAPAGFLPALLIDPSGHVRDASSAGAARFTGDLGLATKSTIIATASFGGPQSLAILQKHQAANFTTDSDLLGFGNAGGGARKFVYDQIASGASNQEWEFAGLQIGQGAGPGSPQYTASLGNTILPYLDGLTAPARPSDGITNMVVSADGIVSETLSPVMGTTPTFLVDSGFMSDDRSVIVAVGTAGDGRFMLRIYQVMNTVPSDATTSSQSDLAGTYSIRKLGVGGAALSASGTLAIDGAGAVTYSSYADSNGNAVLPGRFSLAVGTLDPLLTGSTKTAAGYYGILSNSSDATLHGKLSRDKGLFVFTRTETAGSPGAYSITLGVR